MFHVPQFMSSISWNRNCLGAESFQLVRTVYASIFVETNDRLRKQQRNFLSSSFRCERELYGADVGTHRVRV